MPSEANKPGVLSRRALLRLLPAAGLGLLAGCSQDPETGERKPWINFQIGGDRGTARKAKFGSGRGSIR